MTLTAHPKMPAALIDTSKVPELLIVTQSGKIPVANAFAADKPAIAVMHEILRFLEIRQCRWKATDWSGTPSTPITRIRVHMHDHKMKVCVGRYVGILLDAVHHDGHTMDQKELHMRWNKDRFTLKSAPPAPANDLLLKKNVPLALSEPIYPGSSFRAPNEDGVSFSQQPEKVLRLMTLCHSKLDANETITREQIFEALREVGGVTDSPLRMGRIIYTLTQRGYLVALDTHVYGLDNAALRLLGILPAVTDSLALPPITAPVYPPRKGAFPSPRVPKPEPEETEPEATEPEEEPVPVASTADILGRTPAPANELAGLLQGAEAKLAEVRRLEDRLVNLRGDLTRNEESIHALERERRTLNEEKVSVEAQLEKLSDVKDALERLRQVLGV